MNIIDYIRWRGDLSFENDPFNEVDNLCFSYLSYINIETYFNDINDSFTIKQLSDLYFKDYSDEEINKSKSFIGLAPFVLKEMGKSNRFGNCLVHHLVSILDKDKLEQFCALQIDINKLTTYVAFRGTDDTLLGWEEDFRMAYEISSAQLSAVNYVNKYLSLIKKYYFGGHSKGGNLAIYASIYLKPYLQKNIINIYSNDGPGLLNETIELKEYKKIKDKIIKIVPESSIIGMILFDVGNYRIIKSSNSFILEHDGLSWQTEGNHFEKQDELSELSIIMHNEFNKILKDNSKEDIERFAKYLFSILDELDVTNIHDFSNMDLGDIINALENAKNIDSKSKELLGELIKIFNKVFTTQIKTKASKVIKSIFEK